MKKELNMLSLKTFLKFMNITFGGPAKVTILTAIIVRSTMAWHLLRTTFHWTWYWTLRSIMTWVSFHWNTEIRHGAVIVILSAPTRHFFRTTFLWAHNWTLITIFAKTLNTEISILYRNSLGMWRCTKWEFFKKLPKDEMQNSGISHPFPSSPPGQFIISLPHIAGQFTGHSYPLLSRGPRDSCM